MRATPGFPSSTAIFASAPTPFETAGPVLLFMCMWKAKRSAIGAESSEKILFVSHDLGLLRLSDELDHVALLSDTLFINERIKKAGMNTEIWNCANVFVRDVRRVEHQVRHGHG